MNEITDWITSDPTLEAIAIIASVATAGYYALKALRWLIRLVGSAVTNGAKKALNTWVAKLRAELQLSTQDTHLLLTSLVRRTVNLIYIVLITVAWFSIVQDENSGFQVPQLLKSAVNLTLGLISGAMLAGLAFFVRAVENERKRQLEAKSRILGLQDE